MHGANMKITVITINTYW